MLSANIPMTHLDSIDIVRRKAAIGAALLAAVVVASPADRAYPQGRLDAAYTATLAGIPVGKGRWTIEIGEDKYTASATGATSGLLRVFASGEGTSSARGSVVNGNLVPGNFAATITFDKLTEEFIVGMSAGVVKEVSITPAPQPNPEQVPLTDAHRHGVLDPMTASLIRVAGNAGLTSPDSCRPKLAVFDGRMRYDLQLEFKRVDYVKAEKGYAGPVAVCAVYFHPIAGHNPHRAGMKYLMSAREMEMWLAPIAGTRIVVPYRVMVPTPIGPGILHATEFVTVALPPRATAATAKTP
jgi:hypothetical protein